VHPTECKVATAALAIVELRLPPELVVPMSQHTGAPCRPLVSKGDTVLAGQKIGDAEAFISAPIHAPAAGTVTAVEPRPHFTGTRQLAIVIKPSEEQRDTRLDVPTGREPSPDEIRRIVREAGIVGLGGAAFPTHVKLSPPKEKAIDTLIINGCECEPYLTCDHRNMLEAADRLLDGTRLLLSVVGAKRAIVAIEANKPDAIEHLRRKIAGGAIEVVSLPTAYPQGAEKQLIKAVLGRTIPSGKLPMDVGALVQNVGTAIAVSEAVREGMPLISRTLTVSGRGVAQPANLRVRLGTPLSFVVEACGGLSEATAKVIVGGPMTGFAQFDLAAPVVKGTSGILAFTEEETFRDEIEHRPCIRCGRCVGACPMGIMPNLIGQYARLEDWEATARYDVLDCIECGCCGYLCPARIPLVHLFKLSKAKVIAARKAT
jgi:electron transport complex protein RnfC